MSKAGMGKRAVSLDLARTAAVTLIIVVLIGALGGTIVSQRGVWLVPSAVIVTLTSAIMSFVLAFFVRRREQQRLANRIAAAIREIPGGDPDSELRRMLQAGHLQSEALTENGADREVAFWMVTMTVMAISALLWLWSTAAVFFAVWITLGMVSAARGFVLATNVREAIYYSRVHVALDVVLVAGFVYLAALYLHH